MNDSFPIKEIEDLLGVECQVLTDLGFVFSHKEIANQQPDSSHPGRFYSRWTFVYILKEITLKIMITHPEIFLSIFIYKDDNWFSFIDYLRMIGSPKEIYEFYNEMRSRGFENSDINYVKAFLGVLHKHCTNDSIFRDILLGKTWIKVPDDLLGHK